MMKQTFVFFCLCLAHALAGAGAGDRILMPVARFSTGDNSEWKSPGFDDQGWKEINTSQYYEDQGFAGYDGYSWYRIHVTIPSSFKGTSHWQERLQVFLASIDDVDESFFNGVKIGQTGRMPTDPGGYDSQYQARRDYHVDLRSELVRWDRDNVIAVRVYDGGGGGGFHKGTPYLQMAEKVDGVRLDPTLSTTAFLSGERATTTLTVTNDFPVAQSGTLEVVVKDAASGKLMQRQQVALQIDPMGTRQLPVTTGARAGMQLTYRYQDKVTGQKIESTQVLPYLLTPPESPRPAIHGAGVLGVRPGSPVVYRVAATGRPPLRYAAQQLPQGLRLDPTTGVISGSVAAAGTYQAQLQVDNALGHSARTLSIVVGDTLALTPPMGWNSWTAYGTGVSDALMRQTAQALIDSGLAAHGWSYVNIDDGWESDKRNADGSISGNEKFPDMRALGDFLHERGLRFGIYSSPGAFTCGKFLGTLGHEQQDASSYAQWGVDYLKYDLCSYADTMSPKPSLAEHQKPYQHMSDILRELPRDLLFSLCQYGLQDVWKWGASVRGNAWRTTWDIEDNWDSVVKIGFSQSPYAEFAGPGHWNDPDTLVVGKVGWGGVAHASRLTPDEQYSQLSLWSLLAAPLLIGNDLSHLDAFTRNLLTNDEVIAINQDSLGRAARRVTQQGDWQVWVKELEGGRQAVGVFNLGAQFGSFRLLPSMLGKTGSLRLRDVWRQKELGTFAAGLTLKAPAHGVALVLVR